MVKAGQNVNGGIQQGGVVQWARSSSVFKHDPRAAFHRAQANVQLYTGPSSTANSTALGI